MGNPAETDPARVITVLIVLPLYHNPDEMGVREPVRDEAFLETADEIAKRFEAGGTLRVFREGNPRGFWWHKGVVERDVLAILEVDLPDTPEIRRELKTYVKDVLLKRFRQKAIYLKFVGPVETLEVTDEVVELE